MVAYKLHYFDVRAVAEPIRQIFAYAGVEYEDHRIPREEWPALKEKTPFGQVPYLEVDGKPLPQSFAIARFLAQQFGVAGKDEYEKAWVDALADQYKDYFNDFRNYWYVYHGFREGDKEALKKEFAIPARDKFFAILEKKLGESKSGFLVGDGVTWVDFLLSEHTATVVEHFPGFLDAFPKVLEHSKKIRELPAIKAWIEKRPKTTM